MFKSFQPAGSAKDSRHHINLSDQVVDASQVILLNLNVCSSVNQQLLGDEGNFVYTPLQPGINWLINSKGPFL